MVQIKASIIADGLNLSATSAALIVAYLDHRLALRPSTFLSLYLSVSVILGIAQTRTLWLLAPKSLVLVMMTVAYALTLMALLLESIEKKKSLIADEKSHAPEAKSGL